MTLARGRVLRALALGYLFRALCAALLALPLAAAVGASGIRSFPEGDAKLFEPGGLYLLEVLSSERALLEAFLGPSALLLLVLALAGVAPAWLLVRALNSNSKASADGARSLGRLVPLELATWTARGLLTLTTLGVALTARSFFTATNDERLPLLAASGAALLGVGGWACISVLHDVCLIDIAGHGSSPVTALGSAVGTLRQKALRLAVTYAGIGLASLGVLGASAALVSLIEPPTAGGRPFAVALVHQLGIALQLLLRAAWLRSVLAVHTPRARLEPPPQAEAFL